MNITSQQCAAGRALLGITQSGLAESIGMSRLSVVNFENGEEVKASTIEKIESYFLNSGIRLTVFGGVEFSPKNQITELSGQDGFRAFMDDVYHTISSLGGDVCVSNVNERHWIKWMGEAEYKAHSDKMKSLNNYYFKIMVEEGDDFFIASKFAEYRHIERQYFNEQSFYVYGDKLALLEFSKDNVRINIISNKGWADSFRNTFNLAWDSIGKI